jgi:hypothetical protein
MNRPHLALDEQLIRRIYDEFVEMPGLQLTARQAQRLFGLTEHVCSALLASLVDRKFLVLRSDGRYARVSDGPVLPPNPVFHGLRALVKRTA